uniref:Lon proteolytic domain-containing protein n=1 Tax=Meloidogyne hapla TaxID=6305 RepID=A0A1I8BJQ5_MELHA
MLFVAMYLVLHMLSTVLIFVQCCGGKNVDNSQSSITNSTTSTKSEKILKNSQSTIQRNSVLDSVRNSGFSTNNNNSQHSVYLMDQLPSTSHTNEQMPSGVGEYVALGYTKDECGMVLDIHVNLTKMDVKYKLHGNPTFTAEQSVEYAEMFVRDNAERLKVTLPSDDYKIVTKLFPADVQKDGYSGSCAFVTAIVSLLKKKAPLKGSTILGDIDDDGTIKWVGGLSSKLNAARKSGINYILLPESMRGQYNGLTKHEKEGFRFQFVKNYFQAMVYLFPDD